MKASKKAESSPSPSSSSYSSFHRYLKPGALAQLRDSKISSSRSAHKHYPFPTTRTDTSRSQILPVTFDPTAAQSIRGVLSYGPRCLRRKRLVAARSALTQQSFASGGVDVLVAQ